LGCKKVMMGGNEKNGSIEVLFYPKNNALSTRTAGKSRESLVPFLIEREQGKGGG